MISSCEDDPIGGGPGVDPNEDNPELAFGAGVDFLSSDTALEPGELFSVQLIGAKGAADLSSLTINEDGARITDFNSRVTINGLPASSAAILLPPSDVETFTYVIEIKAKENGSVTLYEFVLTDADGLTARTDIQIDTDSGEVTPPTISLLGNSSIVADAGSLVGFNLDVAPGSLDLASILVLDGDQVEIDPARVYYGGTSAANQLTENPALLPAEDAAGFMKQVFIRAQGDESNQVYLIVIGDTDDNIDLVTVEINTVPGGLGGDDVVEITGALFNRAGPAGTGGLDLDSGASTGSSDSSAELKDNGIDSGPLASNWLQRISGVNGTTVKQLIPNQNGLSETFTYASVTKDTGISGIYGNGVDLQGVNSIGEAWTDVVEVGDMFIALRDGKYYLMVITEIFIDPIGNDDFYRMNIKF